MHRKILIIGLIFAALSVLLGAFGAHALKKMVSVDQLQIFKTEASHCAPKQYNRMVLSFSE